MPSSVSNEDWWGGSRREEHSKEPVSLKSLNPVFESDVGTKEFKMNRI